MVDAEAGRVKSRSRYVRATAVVFTKESRTMGLKDLSGALTVTRHRFGVPSGICSLYLSLYHKLITFLMRHSAKPALPIDGPV
jgi:hypothetical protein